jgi:hypothetical protein
LLMEEAAFHGFCLYLDNGIVAYSKNNL